jgi:hypothetical protein
MPHLLIEMGDLTNFLPMLASNPNPLNLYLPTIWDIGVHHNILPQQNLIITSFRYIPVQTSHSDMCVHAIYHIWLMVYNPVS